jgi:hypothetical protein
MFNNAYPNAINQTNVSLTGFGIHLKIGYLCNSETNINNQRKAK